MLFKQWTCSEFFKDGAEIRVAPRQDPENLRFDVDVGLVYDSYGIPIHMLKETTNFFKMCFTNTHIIAFLEYFPYLFYFQNLML